MKKKIIFIYSIFLLSACIPKIYSSVPTHTPYATLLMPTSHPILPVETQDEFYRLLQSNENCELPCFLGIYPGKNSADKALSFLEPYEYDGHLGFEQIKFSGESWYYGSFFVKQNRKSISFILKLQMKENIISGLIADFDPIFDAERKEDLNSRLLEHYGLLELLQRHGAPNEIFLRPTRNGQSQSAYGIEVVYHTEKILADYHGAAKLAENSKYKLCPMIGDGDVYNFSLALGNPLDQDLNVIELIWGSFNDHFSLESYQSQYPRLDPVAIYDLFVTKGERCFYEDEYRLEK